MKKSWNCVLKVLWEPCRKGGGGRMILLMFIPYFYFVIRNILCQKIIDA